MMARGRWVVKGYSSCIASQLAPKVMAPCSRRMAAVPTASTMRFRFVQQMSQKDAESTMPNRATTMPFGTVSSVHYRTAFFLSKI